MKRILLMLAGLAAGVSIVLPAQASPLMPTDLSQTPLSVQVARGDTLSSLAAGVHTSWWALASYNKLTDPNVIFVGQVLSVPPAGYVPPAMPKPAPAVSLASAVQPAAAPATRSAGPSGWPNSCYGITNPDALWIIARESGCNVYAHNPSGACGIGQRMDRCDGYNGYAQAADMTNYVMSRYGSWAAAKSFWEGHHYY